jgi:hypothetical protein
MEDHCPDIAPSLDACDPLIKGAESQSAGEVARGGQDIFEPAEYRLYDGFQGEPTFPHDPYVTDRSFFWQDAQAFEPATLAANMVLETEFHDVAGAVIFCAEMVILPVLFFVAFAGRNGSAWAGSLYSVFRRSSGFIIGGAFAIAALYFGLMVIDEMCWLRYSMFYSIVLALGGLVFSLFARFIGSIGFLAVVILIAVIQWAFFQMRAEFSALVIRWFRGRRTRLDWGFVSVLLVSCLVLGYFVMAVFGCYYAASLHWSVAFHIFVFLIYWHIVVVVGAIAYQAISIVSTVVYFDVPNFPSARVLLARLLAKSVGISVIRTLLLTVTAPIYFFAKVSVSEIVNLIRPINELIARIVSRVLYFLHMACLTFAPKLDRVFHWPSQRGMIYCAAFGVSSHEGCRRVAELDSRFGANRINAGWHANSVIGVGGLCLETIAGVVGWAFVSALLGDVEPAAEHTAVKAVVGVGAFFAMFTFIHLIRMIIAGMAETLFIWFVEESGSLRRVDPDFAKEVEVQYRHPVPPALPTTYEA